MAAGIGVWDGWPCIGNNHALTARQNTCLSAFFQVFVQLLSVLRETIPSDNHGDIVAKVAKIVRNLLFTDPILTRFLLG